MFHMLQVRFAYNSISLAYVMPSVWCVIVFRVFGCYRLGPGPPRQLTYFNIKKWTGYHTLYSIRPIEMEEVERERALFFDS